ncbi:dentin sialophosphoprotein [Drosophila biarmipes]|uniref:dentin sialophosphoprotein n=1 Tax=Drosophila biarmipes TaxID=125945 RepID=UPI0021CCE184|nr:dentin sialophosphoprotein [Drosophila biarmipes]
MSKSGENDKSLSRSPKSISVDLSVGIGNSLIDEERNGNEMDKLDCRRRASTDMDSVGISVPSTVEVKEPNLIKNYSTSKEQADNSIVDDSSCHNVSKTPMNASLPNGVSNHALSPSSFVYKPYDYTLHGLTDFESTICSVGKDYSELTSCTSFINNQNDTFDSIKTPDTSLLENRATSLGKADDVIDIFSSTMRNPEEMISLFPADDSGISNKSRAETTDSVKENNGQSVIENYEDNPEESKKSSDKKNCNDTLLEYLMEVTEFSENIPSQSQRSVFRQKASSTDSVVIKTLKNRNLQKHKENLQNNFEEMGSTVDKERIQPSHLLESGNLSKDTTLEIQRDNKALDVKGPKINAEELSKSVGKGTINVTLEPGELSEDTNLEEQQKQPAHRISDVEDGEISGEENEDPNDSSKEMRVCQSIEQESSKLKKCGEFGENTISEAQNDCLRSPDMEDGEVSGDDDDYNVPTGDHEKDDSVIPICRFHIRNACYWGSNCRFRHPKITNNKGNYEMFEKKVLPGTVTIPPVWRSFTAPRADTYQTSQADKVTWRLGIPTKADLNDMDNDPYYTPEGHQRAPLLPTPTFDELLMAQKNQNRKVRQPPMPSRPRLITWESRLSISSPSPSPSVSPSRLSEATRSTLQTTSASRHSIKRARSPSPLRSVVNIIRGPRTPSCSPPRRVSAIVRPEPKPQYLSNNSDDCSDSSESTSYESTTESSDEISSSSESDAREACSKRAWKASTSSSRSSEKHASINEGASSSKRAERRRSRSSTSKSRKKSHTQTPPKSSTKTPTRNPLKVMPNAPKKPRNAEDSSYSTKKKMTRQEYLLMQLLRVEEQIAKKKQKRLKASKI